MPSEAEVFDLVNRTLPTNSFIRCFTDYARIVTDAPSSYMMHGAIQAVICACPMNMSIQLGVPIRPNFYTLLVGPSGEVRKTTAIDWCTRLLNMAGSLDYQLIGAASPEGIVRLLGDQPKRLIPITEGGDWLNRTRPGAYLNQLRDNYVALYDGKPIGHQTKDKKKSLKEVKEHHVSVFMGCTPQHLEEYTRTVDFKGGLLNRFLVCYAGERERTISSPVVAPEGEAWLANLLREKIQADHTDLLMGGFTTKGAKAWKVWTRALTSWAKKLPEHRRVVIARAPTHAIKLMQIAAIDCGVAKGEYMMPVECVDFATSVVNWSIQDMLRVSENIAGNKYEQQRMQVLSAFLFYATQTKEIEPISYKQIAGVLNPRQSKRDLDSTIESMLAEGTIYKWSYTGSGAELYSNHPPPIAEYTDADIF